MSARRRSAAKAPTLEQSVLDALAAAYMIDDGIKLLEDALDNSPGIPGGAFIHAALAGHVAALLRSLNDADHARVVERPKISDEEAARRWAERVARDPKHGIAPERAADFVAAFLAEGAAAKDEDANDVTIAVVIDRAKRRMAQAAIPLSHH